MTSLAASPAAPIVVGPDTAALRYFNANKVGLRTGSARYQRLTSEISAAPDPMAKAKALIAGMHRASPAANRKRLRSTKVVGLRQLQAVISEMLAGFPYGLDLTHWSRLKRARANVLAGRFTLTDLSKLAADLRKMQAYDEPNAKWRRFEPVAPVLLRAFYEPAGIAPV